MGTQGAKNHNYLANLCFMAVLVIAVQDGAEADDCGYKSKNLPRWFKPSHYNLELNPDMVLNRFDGRVEITLSRVEKRLITSRRQIIIHAGRSLNISGVELYFSEEQEPDKADHERPIPIVDVCKDDEIELLVILVDESAEPLLQTRKNLVLSMNFQGIVPSNGYGLVRINHTTPARPDYVKRALYTRFGRFGAHSLFPCFDEPRYKVTVKATIGKVLYPREVISNSEIVKAVNYSINGTNYRKFEFEKTHAISIHQFGFIISRFDSKNYMRIDDKADENQTLVLMRFFEEPEISDYPRLILRMINNKMVKLFGLVNPYREPLRIVHFPGVSQAFEINIPGLIVLDTDTLEHDPDKTPNKDETSIYIASIVRLISRQWFGSVITLGLDGQSWLFEGLIGWTMLKVTDDISRFSYAALYARNEMNTALKLEADPAKRQPFPDTTSLDGTYEYSSLRNLAARGDFNLSRLQQVKATSLMNLYEESCTGKFPDLLVKMFERYKYANIEVIDFLHLIQDTCHWSAFMMTRIFTTKPGFSLVKANRSIHENTLLLSQETFKKDYTQTPLPDVNPPMWILPIRTLLGNSRLLWSRKFAFRIIEYPGEQRVALPARQDIRKPGSWAKLNNNYRGFYRILYSDSMLHDLKELGMSEAAREKLGQVDAINLIDDALAVFKSGKVGAYYLVETLTALSNFSYEILNDAMVEAFVELHRLYTFVAPNNVHIQVMCQKIFGHQYLKHKFTHVDLSSSQGRLARAMMYELLAQADFKPLVDDVMREYGTTDFWTIDKMFHGTIFIVVARHGSDTEVQNLIELLESEIDRTSELDMRMLGGFAYAKSERRLRHVWQHIIKRDGDLILQFVLNLLRNSDAENFILSDIVSTIVHQMSIHRVQLGPDKTYELVEAICTKLNLDFPCRLGSPFLGMVNRDRLPQLTVTLAEKRRRNFYLQHVDANKLVFT